MNQKKLFRTMAFAALTAMVVSSCDNANKPTEEKAQAKQPSTGEMKIAYVEIDSIMTQYEFCKEYTKILEKKGQNIQNTIAQKGQTLQAAAAKFQQDVQANKYTREQAEAVQMNLQKQNNDIQALQQRLGIQFQEETEKYNKALRDSIQNFLKAYNKDKKYSYILSKVGDNMLYADKAYDITKEVIAGLNKEYKSGKKAEANADKK
ncbi:MAG: OmpH family outer membrane protein [Prevotella sp.]|nr:OmpH family outer membrane protein [Prevotella sp.]